MRTLVVWATLRVELRANAVHVSPSVARTTARRRRAQAEVVDVRREAVDADRVSRVCHRQSSLGRVPQTYVYYGIDMYVLFSDDHEEGWARTQ